MQQTVLISNFGSVDKKASKIQKKQDIGLKEPPFVPDTFNFPIHQSLDRMIEPKYKIDDTAEIVCIERLGGLLKSYHRLAA